MIAKRLLAIQKASSPPAPAATDVYYDYRSLILNMQGASGSTTFTDSSPNNFAITPYGNAQLASDATFGTVASFDGSGDYLSIPSNAAFNFGAGDFTIEAWFLINSGSNGGLFFLSGNASLYAAIRLGFFSSKIYLLMSSTGASWQLTTGLIGPNLVSGTWYHVSVTKTGSLIKVYLNGLQIGIDYNLTGSLVVMQDYFIGTTRNEYLNGLIGPLRISPWAVYTSNFTPSQDLFPAAPDSIYANPYYDKVALSLKFDGTNGSTSFVDTGPNAFAVTPSGNAQITSASKYGSGAGAFDGNGDALQVPLINLTSGDFTIEGWVYFNSVSGVQVVVSSAGTGANYGGLLIALNGSSQLAFYLSTSVNTWNLASNALFSATPVTTGLWYHFALVRNGSIFSPFLNGIAGATVTSSVALYNHGTPLKIGAERDANLFPANGSIDELEVTKGVAKYKANFTPPVRGLSTIYNPYTTLPVSGAALWLDGADSSTLFTDAGVTPVNKSGDLVYQWSDKSGNNRHATQATSANRPTWVPPASGQNGFGVLGFNGTSQFLRSNYLSIPQTFIVVGLNSSTGTREWAGSDSSNGGIYGAWQTKAYAASTNLAINIAKTNGTLSELRGVSIALNELVMHVTQFDGSVIYNSKNNGAFVSQSIGGTPATPSVGTNIGAGFYNRNNVDFLNGKICEMVIYDRLLDSTELTQTYNYLKAKWGTP